MQVMLTLAALAYTDETAKAGESIAQQEQRILNDLNNDPTYGLQQGAATQDWFVVCAGLSADPQRPNLALIAKSSTRANTYAIAIRGTDFKLFMDALEDIDVTETVPFASGGNIARGAADAFALVTGAEYLSGGSGAGPGTNLLAALRQLVEAAPPGTATTLYVTGHSLGGAIATTVSLYLRQQTWTSPLVFQVYTYAAPTAGDQLFADAFNAAFPGTAPGVDSSWRVYNAYDVVPNAWQTIEDVAGYYPTRPDRRQPWRFTCSSTASASTHATTTMSSPIPGARPVPWW